MVNNIFKKLLDVCTIIVHLSNNGGLVKICLNKCINNKTNYQIMKQKSRLAKMQERLKNVTNRKRKKL